MHICKLNLIMYEMKFDKYLIRYHIEVKLIYTLCWNISRDQVRVRNGSMEEQQSMVNWHCCYRRVDREMGVGWGENAQ